MTVRSLFIFPPTRLLSMHRMVRVLFNFGDEDVPQDHSCNPECKYSQKNDGYGSVVLEIEHEQQNDYQQGCIDGVQEGPSFKWFIIHVNPPIKVIITQQKMVFAK